MQPEMRVTRRSAKNRDVAEVDMCEAEASLALVVPDQAGPSQCTSPEEVALQPCPPPHSDISTMLTSLQPMGEAPQLDFKALVANLPGELNVENL